ncbi:MBL fold metallo-hydrolase [Chloroflexota bacterium]
MNEVLPGVFQLPLPLPNLSLDHVNTYLVRNDSECLLIDTGWNIPESFNSLKAQLEEIGVGFEDISQIIITHIHPDHYGLAGKMKQVSPAMIALHYKGKDNIESRYINMDNLLDEMTQWLRSNGTPADELSKLQMASVEMAKHVTATPPDVTLRGGELITCGDFHFNVLCTPGHAPDHISLYEPHRRLFISGDHILPRITPNIGLHPQTTPNPLRDYLNSLNSIKQLDVSLVLPGHEEPFTNLKQRVEQLIEHHRVRNSGILKVLGEKTKTAYQIATELKWKGDINKNSWNDLIPLDRRIAVLETLSHLEAMRADGKIERLSKNGIIYYQRRRDE